MVRKGQLLFVIDPKPFEATVARARADVAEAQARHNRAEIQVNRLRPLVADNAVSQQDLDNAVGLRGSQPGQPWPPPRRSSRRPSSTWATPG